MFVRIQRPVDAIARRLWRRMRVRFRGDAGMTTAEYAVGTIAAVAFAGLLVGHQGSFRGLLLKVLTSDTVSAALNGIIEEALS